MGLMLPPALLRPSFATLDTTANANSPTYSNGNLRIAATSASGHATRSTVSRPTGKTYFEVTIIARGSGGYVGVGVCSTSQSLASPPTSLASVPGGMWIWRDDANRAQGGVSASFGTSWATNDIIGVTFDMATTSLWWSKNGTPVSGNPSAGTGGVYTNLSGTIGACIAFFGTAGSPIVQANFGDTPFAYAPPTDANSGIYS